MSLFHGYTETVIGQEDIIMADKPLFHNLQLLQIVII